MCNRSIILAAQDLNVRLHFPLLSWVSRSFMMGLFYI